MKKIKTDKINESIDEPINGNVETIDDILEVVVVIEKPKRGKKNVEHYVNPRQLEEKIITYYDSGNLDNMDTSLAEDISKIANRLSFRPNFINYSYKEEMVGDAIVKMFSALRNKKFTVNGGYNPFAYFTRIAFNAFINRIKKEKRNHTAIQEYQEEVYKSLIDSGHAVNTSFKYEEND